MINSKRNISIVLILTILLTVFVAGMSSVAAKDNEENLKFGFSIMILDNPYFISVKKGFEDRCEELGVEPVIVDAKYDVAKQVNTVNNMIQQQVDAMMIAPIDQNALHQPVERAKEEGIVVISEAQPIDNAHGIYTIDEYEYGLTIGGNAAKWINENLDGEAKVIIISQDNVEAVIQRGNGIEDAIKDNTDAEIVARQAGDTPAKGMNIVNSVMQRHPDVKVVVGVNDSAALGGHEAVQAMDKATSDFFVGGADATAQAIAKMKEEGSVYRATVDILPYETGVECADIMYDYVMNGTPDEPETFYMSMKPVWQEDVLSGEYQSE